MEWESVIIRAITFVVIFSLVRVLVPFVLGKVRHNKGDGNESYFDKKMVSYIFLGIAIFFTVLFSFLINIPSNVNGDAKIVLIIGLYTFCGLWYALSLMYGLWYIFINENKIIFRNYFGKRREITQNSVDRFELKPNGKLILYIQSRKVAVFESEYADEVEYWLSKKHIACSNKADGKDFTITPAFYLRVLSIFALVFFFSMFVVSIIVGSVMASIAFCVCSLLGILYCAHQNIEKYVIHNDCIEIRTLFKKQTVAFSNVDRAEIVEKDDVSYIMIYEKRQNKPVLKVSTNYNNAFLLSNLVYRKKWIK